MQYLRTQILLMISILLSIFIGCRDSVESTVGERTDPLRVVVDLNVGESVNVELDGGLKAAVKLLATDFEVDEFRNAVRLATATVEVNGERIVLESGNYNLPRQAGGLRLDCPATSALYSNTNVDRWGLDADARIRIWPPEGNLIDPRTFGYPVDQRFLANDTQMSNEPCYVNGCEIPSDEPLYYHSGLDFGGTEGMTKVLAATDGLVVSVGDSVLDGHKSDTPVMPRYDVVYVMDKRGWYYRYSHLHSIDPAILPGDTIRLGQQLGLLGKEGGSGGWSHLHFEVKARQPSGRWGTEDAYAYAMQAYLNKYNPAVIAVARPHQVSSAGETVVLDAGRSVINSDGEPDYKWLLSDGSEVAGQKAERKYNEPGTYHETLIVTDNAGKIDYDFCVVQVLDNSRPALAVPVIHVNYYPSIILEPGRNITFKVRTFNAPRGQERWDFGDGSPEGITRSVTCWGDASLVPDGEENPMLHPAGYATINHSYDRPGDYLVTVRSETGNGIGAMARVHVAVGSR